MAMIVQHNMTAMNTNRQLGISTKSLAKSTEKLSSGYRINRAADDAAGLDISEKMRSQIRGLDQASTNASDGISMIQTAEGALNESHSILQRMRELAVQAANGTETDSDRGNIQDEIEQLQEELDRIAEDTEFNTMKLLDGSLSAATAGRGEAGPKFGVYDAGLRGFVTSDVKDVQIDVKTTASLGGESAIWDDTGKILTLNLAANQTYTESELDDLIANAKQEDSTATGTPAKVELNLNYGSFTASQDSTGAKTVAGAKASASSTFDESVDFVGANKISFKANKYGEEYNFHLDVFFTADAGKERCEVVDAITYTSTGALSMSGSGFGKGGYRELYLQTGKEYSAEDIEQIFLEYGLDIDVTLSGATPDEPNTLFVVKDDAPLGGSPDGYSLCMKLTGGAGLGDTDAFLGQEKYGVTSGGKGIILQIGANEGQTMSFSIDDMSARALGVNESKVNMGTQKSASDSIGYIDEAIQKVSKQRSLLGAVQNRLEHTIANLDNTAENLQAAESRIRDVDMASEMVNMSKYNILQQAGQSMLAQANQATQGVLSLIQG